MRGWQVGDYINEWVRSRDLPGEDGERRHLLTAVVQQVHNGAPFTSEATPLACGLRLGLRIWDFDETAPKCEKCSQIADGDTPKAREDVPAPREREPIAA